jgi:hypothetical protein
MTSERRLALSEKDGAEVAVDTQRVTVSGR